MSNKNKTDWFKDRYKNNATLVNCKNLGMSAEEALGHLADSYDKLLHRFIDAAERRSPFSAVLRFEKQEEEEK